MRLNARPACRSPRGGTMNSIALPFRLKLAFGVGAIRHRGHEYLPGPVPAVLLQPGAGPVRNARRTGRRGLGPPGWRIGSTHRFVFGPLAFAPRAAPSVHVRVDSAAGGLVRPPVLPAGGFRDRPVPLADGLRERRPHIDDPLQHSAHGARRRDHGGLRSTLRAGGVPRVFRVRRDGGLYRPRLRSVLRAHARVRERPAQRGRLPRVRVAAVGAHGECDPLDGLGDAFGHSVIAGEPGRSAGDRGGRPRPGIPGPGRLPAERILPLAVRRDVERLRRGRRQRGPWPSFVEVAPRERSDRRCSFHERTAWLGRRRAGA